MTSQKLTGHPDDDYNLVTLPSSASDDSKNISTKTTWTLLIYLTSAAEGCRGGETVFYPKDRKVESEAIPVALETGMLLLHKHGDDCLLVCFLSFQSDHTRNVYGIFANWPYDH